MGKTTLVQYVLQNVGSPFHYVSADEPALRGRAWLTGQWEVARALALKDRRGAVLAVDEVQKIPGWSEQVKRLWDEDTRARTPLKVVLLGSSPLLMERGIHESLAGRFETLRLPHWSFPEMRQAFGVTLDEYVFYGGYPGAAALRRDAKRWSRYILDSLVETTISRDVLLLTRVDKPALLRQLFHLACTYSGQILSYTKMLGQLTDAGNTTTLAHYLDLLSGAGMVTGLPKYSGSKVRQRTSSPKLQVLNTALMTAPLGLSLSEAKRDRPLWGRILETAVGAHIANAARYGNIEAYYWRDRNQEVDYVIQDARRLAAIEVKSGPTSARHSGLDAFAARYKPDKILLVGSDGHPVQDFLERPADSWLRTDPERLRRSVTGSRGS